MFTKRIGTLLFAVLIFAAVFVMSSVSWASNDSRFDAVNFVPAVDGGSYNVVYGSQNLKAWQGTMGFYFDYANRPLEFRSTGAATGRQSVVDHSFIINAYGALGFTDWFEAGINIPAAPYIIYYTDDAAARPDKGGSMGDILVMTKFRIVDINKSRIGFSVMPYMTLPTGDVVRYMGNGHVTGGLNLIVDGRPIDRLELSLNLGGVLRDDVTRNYVFTGGATSTVRVDDLFTYGFGANFKISKYFQTTAEVHGSTVIRDFFSTRNITSLEAGAGVRYYIGDSGFVLDAGGSAGLIEGIGTPRFRGYLGLRWISPGPQECAPAPDPRIQGNKIVLWGKIFYDTAKAKIKPISYPVLDDVVDVLVKNPGITLVEVQGHTDWRGSDSYNMKLSDRRANSAMQYLIGKGISASRLVAKGYGESQPIASNDTVEGMSQNRRTEFVILQSSGGYVNAPTPGDVTTVTNTVVTSGGTTTESISTTTETPPVIEEETGTTNQNGVDGQPLPNYSG